MSAEQNSKFIHKVKVTARDRAHFEELITIARDMFGHHGKENGWRWTIDGPYRDRKMIFRFRDNNDATIFKLCI